MSAAQKPVLWQLGISHYSEKARWALAYKRVEHERRTPPPGVHMLQALWLTRGAGRTLPALRLDGRIHGDSSEIIATLEERYPEPPLYPADPAERRRALELEGWLDEEVGPAVRLLGWHEVTGEGREALTEIAARTLPAPVRSLGPARAAAALYGQAFARLRYRVGDEEAAARARETILAALDRLEAELGDADYLVGDAFSVADLTAAALLYPLVLPAQAPRLPDLPPALERFRSSLSERRAYRFVEEMYRRHRRPAASQA